METLSDSLEVQASVLTELKSVVDKCLLTLTKALTDLARMVSQNVAVKSLHSDFMVQIESLLRIDRD